MVESVADYFEKLIHAVCNASGILNSFIQTHIWSLVNEWGHCEDHCQNNLEDYFGKVFSTA